MARATLQIGSSESCMCGTRQLSGGDTWRAPAAVLRAGRSSAMGAACGLRVGCQACTHSQCRGRLTCTARRRCWVAGALAERPVWTRLPMAKAGGGAGRQLDAVADWPRMLRTATIRSLVLPQPPDLFPQPPPSSNHGHAHGSPAPGPHERQGSGTGQCTAGQDVCLEAGWRRASRGATFALSSGAATMRASVLRLSPGLSI